MAKSKKEKVKAKSDRFKREIYGIILLALSLLIGLSIYIKPAGIAGLIFRDFFCGLLGLGSFLFPVIMFLIAMSLIINKGKLQIKRRFSAICLLVYDLLLLMNLNISYSNRNLELIQRISRSYNAGIKLKGGGIISEIIDIPLLFVFGKTGAYIILVCFILICLLFATEKSIGDFIVNTYNKFISGVKKSSVNNIPLNDISEVALYKQENRAEDRSNSDNERKIFEDNIEKMDKKIKILDFLKNENDELQKKEKESDVKNELSIYENDLDINSQINKESVNKEYFFPPLDLLIENKVKSNTKDKKDLLNNAKILEETLESFGVDAKVVQVSRGPAVTRYELHPGPGVKVSRIVNLADDIALNLAAPTVRIEAPVPGKAVVGIEVPNKEVVTVTLKEVLESKEFIEFNSNVTFGLGKDISGKCIVTDLSKMPHLLIAGATGSGKSVCINTLITSLVYKSSPLDVKMLMIDPKVVELSVYNGIPHLLIPVVTDAKKAASALFWAVNEMTQRYKIFADNNVRNIESYNRLIDEGKEGTKMPQVVIIIDELADLMIVAPNDVEDAICRLAQMARAAGMHLVIATQRPSVDVITGVIKANIPSRISFAVSSQIDSRTILDMSGAEKLLGKGDMLFFPIGEVKPMRIQGAFISEKEVERVVDYIKQTDVDYNSNIMDEIEKEVEHKETENEVDELLPEAIKLAIDCGQVSASMLQRRLRIGFNRAARLIEEMELRKIIGPSEGSKPRQVLISREEYDSKI